MIRTIIIALAMVISATIISLPGLHDIYIYEIEAETEQDESTWFEFREV